MCTLGKSALCLTLYELQQLSYSQFLSLLQTTVTSQLAKSEYGGGDGTAAGAAGGDLSPSLTTSSLLGRVSQIAF